ncbi:MULTISPECIES: TetR/AcrR family transcriptional regulator [unclassified Arthrobacter]|uniref:TetR/AcrR family transcriptional regulator n=1 Tax=unclassified Arthrobacter TaxID=235627 RepID=UPI001E419DC1|nr:MULTISPECIES: TetR/AcrR family transcriptional regulator [unclassified Arthrobacter]MCC9145050.1 TetR/AcrR family transcriptional regulator [Arthrobacter sp. zg-Y919]MDK1276278.1 TetR/AcrR family transcriptional regulator [Arthrobacter sp. zg.Y919]WIB02116.1 TetR/AcrR family transcriptional regulator [Arthrobacter sp. zg-Y919]
MGPVEAEPAKRSRTATRSRLLATSAAVFAERGLEGASVEELCAAAGFTRGAFYSNFASKTELALAMYEDHARQLAERLNRQLDHWLRPGGLEPTAVIEHTLEGMADFTSDTVWHAVRLELLLAARRSERVRTVVADQRAVLSEAVTAALIRVAEAQDTEFTVDVSELARSLLALYDGRLNEQIAGGDAQPAQLNLAAIAWQNFTRPRPHSQP